MLYRARVHDFIGLLRGRTVLSDDLSTNFLWPILVETVHSLILYTHHKAYVRDVTLHEKPDISPHDLAMSLNISLGEAMVILNELKGGKSE